MIGHSFTRARWLFVLILVAFLFLFVIAACGTPRGERLVDAKCTGCHTRAIIGVSSKTAHEWLNTVYRMEKLGADVDEQQIDALVEYLADNFGPMAPVP